MGMNNNAHPHVRQSTRATRATITTINNRLEVYEQEQFHRNKPIALNESINLYPSVKELNRIESNDELN
jgi:sulfate adenylyltransferase subunit 1 (EFTu-like GTPase family)